MRNIGAVALRDLPDGLALARVHLLAVEREGNALAAVAFALYGVGRATMCDVRPPFDLGVAACGALVVVAVADGLRRIVHGFTICPKAWSDRRGNI
jgi:hypothetical protein